MKKTVVLAIATLASASALGAGKLIVRSDYVNTPNYKNASNADVGGTSLLLPVVARMNMDAKVGEAMVVAHLNLRSFATEFSGTFPSNSVQKSMTVDKFVERLYIVKSLGDFAFTSGKINVNVGGFEKDAVVEGDDYLTSLANNGVGGKNGTTQYSVALPIGASGTVVMPENNSGVGVAYTMGDHKVEVQATNQTVQSDAMAANRRHSLGLQYDGSCMDKTLMFRVGYTSGVADTAAGTGNVLGISQTFTNVGLMYKGVENLTLGAEMLSNSSKSDAAAAKADTTTSNLITARYNMGMYAPVFKYEMSENKVQELDTTAATATGMGSFKRTGMALALEIVPKAEDSFRYHVALASATDKYGQSGKTDVKFNQITVGMKYTGGLW